jgi:hypothetical protein
MRSRHLLIGLGLGALAVLGLNSAAPASLLINEMDSDSVNTPTTDAFEFVELYETTGTSVPLDGLVLVFFNGNGNVVYRAEDLDGLSTHANGYFVAGSVAGADRVIPGNTIQNGVDAIALYTGNASDFPNGTLATAPIAANPIDAIVYETGPDTDGIGLAAALGVNGPPADEFAPNNNATDGANHSLGRLPNASGAVKDNNAFTPNTPTAGAPNAAIPEPATISLLTGALALGTLRRRRLR